MLHHFCQVVTLLAGFVAGAVSAAAEAPPVEAVPQRPLTQAEQYSREARTLYGIGILQQRGERLVEATRTFEEGLRLDPSATSIHRALVPLYVVLCRFDDALAACRKVLDEEPGDYETWNLYGQQLRAQGLARQAWKALGRARSCAGLADRPELRVQIAYDFGVLSEEIKEYRQALGAFREVVGILEKPEQLLDSGPYREDQLKEQAANTYERMVKVCIQAKDFDQALLLFREAKNKNPILGSRLNYSLAKLCSAQGKQTEALGYLDAFLNTQPQGTEAYELKISLLDGLGRHVEVLPWLRASAERDPHNLALQLLLARRSHRAGQSAEAEKLYRLLAEKSPTADVYSGLLSLYRDQHRLGEVLQLLQETLPQGDEHSAPLPGATQAAAKGRALVAVLRDDAELVKALLPEARMALRSRTEVAGNVRYFLAVLASRTGQLDDAESLYRSCLTGRFQGPRFEVAIYDGLLKVLWQGSKYEAIAELCAEGLTAARNSPRPLFLYNRSLALAYLGRFEEALADADQAIATTFADERSRFSTRLNRAEVLRLAGKHERATADCQAMLREFTQPGDVRRVRYELSHIYSSQRDYDKAEEQLRVILDADPNEARANNDLGYFWADQGKNLDEAERLIRKAIDLDRQQKRLGPRVEPDGDEDNAAYIDSLGWVLFRKGQFEAARNWLEKAASLPMGKDDPVVWDHLGDALFRLDLKSPARSTWEKARRLYEKDGRRKADEHYEEVKVKLERVGRDRD